MKTYRMNAVMAGALYFLGTVFGILGGIIGGEVLTSIIIAKPLAGMDMLDLVAAGTGSAALQSMGNVLYQFQDFTGPVGTIVFLIGATWFIHLLLPHPADSPLAVRLGLERKVQ